MASQIVSVHSVSDLARRTRALIAKAQKNQEPIVITQRGREVAALLPIELYRELTARTPPRIRSPLLSRREDAGRFQVAMTMADG
jgi:prevent-host-death family protein